MRLYDLFETPFQTVEPDPAEDYRELHRAARLYPSDKTKQDKEYLSKSNENTHYSEQVPKQSQVRLIHR